MKHGGGLKMQKWKMREWKYRHETVRKGREWKRQGVEKAGVKMRVET